jgi:hypothetical protein
MLVNGGATFTVCRNMEAYMYMGVFWSITLNVLNYFEKEKLGKLKFCVP